MQYVGEYDLVGQGSLTRLALHVDGTFDATVSGRTTSGTFLASGGETSLEVHAVLTASGATSTATFHAAPPSAAPSRDEVDLEGDLGEASLFAPWLSGDEAACDATGGAWTDDDPDPATGLYCTCPAADLYVPSRGGCVGASAGADPARVPASDAMHDAVGSYLGQARVTRLQLEDDGTYTAVIDGQPDDGTWWDDGAPGTFALTSPARAFWVNASSQDLTLDLGTGTETLHRDR